MKINNLSREDNKLLKPLVSRVLNKCEIHPGVPVNIDDWDLDRVYLTIDGHEYIIRTCDIHESDKMIIIDWSLVLFREGENHGTLINSGICKFRTAKVSEKND